MKSFSRMVTSHPWAVFIIGLILMLPAALAAIKTPINYDMLAYMPAQVESIKGQLLLQEDFKIADTAFLMLKDKKTAEVLEIQRELQAIEGVEHVSWINDLVDPTIPQMFIPGQVKDMYIKDEYTMMNLTFTEPAAADLTREAVKEIVEYLKDKDASFIGMPVIMYEMNQLMDSETNRSILAATILSIVVIAIAMKSLLLPFVVLFSIGVGIVLNMGTNFVFGSISYISGGIAAAIQLGVTLDFSIFLIHRFYEECERRGVSDSLHDVELSVVREIMTETIRGTFKAILPSALTTMAGFMALAFMQMGIGLDMGLVMAKGVFWGLIATITMLPAMILIFKRFIKVKGVKQQNKGYRKMAKFVTKHAWLLAFAFVACFWPLNYAKNHTEISYNINEMMPENMPSIQALEEIKEVMGSIEMAYILYPKDIERWKLMDALDEVGKLSGVTQVISLVNMSDPALPQSFVPMAATEGFTKGDLSLAMVRLSVEAGTHEANSIVDQTREILKKHGVQPSIFTGPTPSTKDMVDLSKSDIRRVNIASMLSIFIIIALVFFSPTIPLILVAGIELAIFSNLSVPYFTGEAIPHIAVTCISAIQLGSTVDYAILLMSRYRDYRVDLPPKEAMEEAMTNSAPAILAAGFSLAAATFGIAFVSEQAVAKSLTAMIGRGALISMATIVVFLPAVIVKCDTIIKKTSFGWKNMYKES